MKIGDIVRDRLYSGQIGVIVAKYKGNEVFDWEVIALEKPFSFGHTWQDCFTENSLEPYYGEIKSKVNKNHWKNIMNKLVLEAI